MLLKRKEEMCILAGALRDELKQFTLSGINQDLDSEILEPIRTRLSATPLRAFFARQMFLIIKDHQGWKKRLQYSLAGDEDLFLVKIPFVFEVIITIQYLHNQVLDKKNGINTHEKAAKNMLTANILKDYLYEYIETEFPENTATTLTKTVRKAFKVVDAGQLLEKKHNTFQQFRQAELMDTYKFSKDIEAILDFSGLEAFMDQLNKDLPRNYREFSELYLKRIFLTCAALFTLCTDFLCTTLGVEEQVSKNLMKFAAAYGMMRQIINDNADLVPAVHGLSTLSKLPEDAFSDLRNRNITLPLIYHLSQSPNGMIAQWLGSEEHKMSNADQQAFSRILLEDHSLFKSIQMSRLLAKTAEDYLTARSASALLLADTCQIAWWNKFLAPVVKTKAYKTYRKTAHYRQMKKLLTQPVITPRTKAIVNIPSRDSVKLTLALNFKFR
jgi:geranylgeranyl pyrophosphate synthase